jgi:hypothetical protein
MKNKTGCEISQPAFYKANNSKNLLVLLAGDQYL